MYAALHNSSARHNWNNQNPLIYMDILDCFRCLLRLDEVIKQENKKAPYDGALNYISLEDHGLRFSISIVPPWA